MIRTLPELANGLNTIFPTRYSHFTSKTALPYICYIDTGYENLAADNTVIIEGTFVDIEFYSEDKDLTGESKIKTLLNLNELPYTQSPTIYIEAEGFFQSIFSIKLLNKPMEVI